MSVWTSWPACLQALAGRGQREAAGAGRPHRQGLDPHLAASGVTLALQSSCGRVVTSSLKPVLGGPGPVECGQPKGSGIVV